MDGTLVLVSRITPRRGPPVEVFNLEVDVDHVDHVGSDGILVHNHYVYWSEVNGVVEYVGITGDIGRRAREHLRTSGRVIDKLFDNVSPQEARAIEQALIVRFGLGNLSNKINSISPSRSDYDSLLKLGQQLLEAAGI